jgi:hypothetical protein
MLLEHLLEFDIKRRALELQSMLLEHPYGEHMHVELEAMPWQDAFDGTNVKLGPTVMDKPTIVLKVNDDFDSQRVEQYGPDGVKVTLTQDDIYMPANPDEPSKLLKFDSKGGLTEHLDQMVVNRALKHFVVMPSSSRDAFFDNDEADNGVAVGLTFMVDHDDPKFYRHKAVLTSKELKVGQLLLLRTSRTRQGNTGATTILKLQEVRSDDLSFSGMQEAFDHFKASSLSGLLKVTTRLNRVVLVCQDVGTGVESKVFMKPQGAAATWAYGSEPCSLALMEQV